MPYKPNLLFYPQSPSSCGYQTFSTPHRPPCLSPEWTHPSTRVRRACSCWVCVWQGHSPAAAGRQELLCFPQSRLRFLLSGLMCAQSEALTMVMQCKGSGLNQLLPRGTAVPASRSHCFGDRSPFFCSGMLCLSSANCTLMP